MKESKHTGKVTGNYIIDFYSGKVHKKKISCQIKKWPKPLVLCTYGFACLIKNRLYANAKAYCYGKFNCKV